MSVASSVFRRLCFAFLLSLAVPGVTTAAVLPHVPPPPQGPAIAPSDAPRSFPVNFFRQLLENEGTTFIEEHNESSPHKLSWAAGARPTECGYDCMGPPSLTSSREFDQPNERIVEVRGRLSFDVDINNNPFSRRIITNYTIRARCNGWEDGSGRISITPLFDQPFVDDDKGPFEQIVDFLLLPLNLSNSIDAGVKAELDAADAGGSVNSSNCRSLGVDSHFNTDQFFQFDAIVWEAPTFIPGISLSHATVVFDSIMRKPTLTNMDTTTPVLFDLYVNGKLLQVEKTGGVVIAPGATVPLHDVSALIPLTDNVESLQVIVSDSLGGAGWSQFGENTGFGDGPHVLITHRKELAPVGTFPGIDQPVPLDLHEFEIRYTIHAGPVVIEQPVGSGPGVVQGGVLFK